MSTWAFEEGLKFYTTFLWFIYKQVIYNNQGQSSAIKQANDLW